MKEFVLDSSLALAFVFKDEATAETDKILDSFLEGFTAIAPALWKWEIANVLVQAERRQRIEHAEAQRHLELLKQLPVEIEAASSEEAWGAAFDLARQHKLTSYDAAYLEIALRRAVALGSLDRDLRAAANAEGVALFPKTL